MSWHAVARAILLSLAIGLPFAEPANALDPNRSVRQYAHARWTVDNGAPSDINAITQTRDGYLWVGATSGLYRFDGIAFEQVSTIDAESAVTALAVIGGRDLWVGLRNGHIIVFHDGRQIERTPSAQTKNVGNILEARDGSVWALSFARGYQVARFSAGRWTAYGEAEGLPASATINAMMPAPDGAVWTISTGDLRVLRRNGARFEQAYTASAGLDFLVRDSARDVWLTDGRVDIQRAPSPAQAGRRLAPSTDNFFTMTAMLDRNHALWAVTSHGGLTRLRAPSGAGRGLAPERYGASDGLTSDATTTVFEDREGDIWVGTARGLDRFSPANVVVETDIPQLSPDGYILAADRAGAVYVADSDTLYRAAPGGEPVPLLHGIANPMALCEGQPNEIWVAAFNSVRRLRLGQTPQPPISIGSRAFERCQADASGNPWFLGMSNNFIRQQGRNWRRQDLQTERDDQVATRFAFDTGGRLLVFFENRGLVRIDDAQHMLWPVAQIPGGRIGVIYAGPHATLIAGVSGLARLRGDRIVQLPGGYEWLRHVSGIVEDDAGQTWIQSTGGIFRVSTEALARAFDDPRVTLLAAMFDVRDGLPGPNQIDYAQNGAVRGGDGRLWFTTQNGIVWIDPTRLVRNPLPPPVTISRVVADGRVHEAPAALVLAPGTANLQINYAALSLQAPERNRFRYKLEGVDPTWIDPGSRRQAFYNRLPPGTYRFQVIAANNDGVWNRVGATLAITQRPTFLQTAVFRVLFAGAVLLALWFVYRMRLASVTARLRARMEVRLAERERIARDLHDTLLQGVHGLVLRFQAIANRMGEADLKTPMEDALERAEDMILESRERIHDLRRTDLPEDMLTLLEAAVRQVDFDASTSVRVQQKRRPRSVVAEVRMEIYGIAQEALSNAKRHAGANRVEVIVSYHWLNLAISIADNGTGMDTALLPGAEKPGHFGIVGMRERAERMNGSLDIHSVAREGTTVTVKVPAMTAYRGNGKLEPLA